MKKIIIGIQLSKVFDSCQQWTQNRVWLRDNPNKSRDTLNFTYAMSEDDEAFFEEYSETVCAEIAVYDSFRLLRKYTKECFTSDYEFNYTGDYCKFNYVVSNGFSVKGFHTLLYKLVQFLILRYWYWEKNLYEELSFIDSEIENLRKRIEDIIINEAKAKEDESGDPMDIVPYNDGFTINPPRRRRRLPRLEDETEEYGITAKEDIKPEVEDSWITVRDLPEEITIGEDNRYSFTFIFSRRGSKAIDTLKSIQAEFLYDGEVLSTEVLSPLVLNRLPIKVNSQGLYMKNPAKEYYYKIYLEFADGEKQLILESIHCQIKANSFGVYTDVYTDEYDISSKKIYSKIYA